jgi:MFS family permease
VLANILCSMAMFTSMAVITPTLEEVVRARFVSEPSAVKLFTMAGSLPQLLFIGVLAGLWSDRLGRRYPLILPCALITGLLSMAIPLVESLPALIALRLVDGATGIVALGLIMAKMLDFSARWPERRATIMAAYGGSIPASYLLGNLLTVALAPQGVEVIYAVGGGSVVLSVLLLVAFSRGGESGIASLLGQQKESFSKSLRTLPRIGEALVFGFADKLVVAATVILTSRAMAELYEREGSRAAGGVLALYFLGFLLLSPATGWAFRTFGLQPTLYLSSLLHGVVLFLMPQFGLGGFAVLMAVGGALTPFQFLGCLAILGQRSESGVTGTHSQVFNYMGSIGMVVGFPLFAVLADADPTLKIAYGTAGTAQVLAVFLAVVGLGFTRMGARWRQLSTQGIAKF